MSPKLFLFVAASLSALLGSALTYGLIPTDYAGFAAGVAAFLASVIRPPEKT